MSPSYSPTIDMQYDEDERPTFSVYNQSEDIFLSNKVKYKYKFLNKYIVN